MKFFNVLVPSCLPSSSCPLFYNCSLRVSLWSFEFLYFSYPSDNSSIDMDLFLADLLRY